MPWGSRRRRRTATPGLRAAVRIGAGAALAASIVVPLIRKRARIPAPVTVGALAAGPLALAVLRPRTRTRDAALYALQMWGFTMAHELPFDDPEALRRRLRIEYPLRADRLLGGGEIPTVRLQTGLAKLGRANALDRVLTWVHWLWFLEPHAALAWILWRDPESFPRAARQMSAAYDLGCAVYFAVPTSPPWWAAEEGHSETPVRRIMVEVGEETWGRAWPGMYDALGGNPWAAMPSLHFATSLLAAKLLAESDVPGAGAAGWGYALALGFALVYLGEHYVTDLAAGAALIAAVRGGEPHVEPLVIAVNRVLQRLERIADP